MTGRELYKVYQELMEQQLVEVIDWDELYGPYRVVWNELAKR